MCTDVLPGCTADKSRTIHGLIRILYRTFRSITPATCMFDFVNSSSFTEQNGNFVKFIFVLEHDVGQ